MEKQQIILKGLKLPCRINIMQSWKHFPDAGVIFLYPVRIADRPLIIGRIGKFQQISLTGRKLPVEIIFPYFIPFIPAHYSGPVHHSPILRRNLKSHLDFHILLCFIKIGFRKLLHSWYNPDCIKDRGFTRIILSHQNQSVFDITNLHITYHFVISDSETYKLHGLPPFGRLMQNFLYFNIL